MHQLIRALPLIAACMMATQNIAAQSLGEKVQKLPIVELSAEATQSVVNDLGRTTAYVELADSNPNELAQKVNQKTGEMLAIARNTPTVKVRTSTMQTYPIYGKTGSRIESWRMRSEIQLESQDIAALSGLIGRLQSIAAITQLNVSPAPDTQQKALDSATVAAIKAFRARAELVAQTLGKPWRIRTLQLNSMPENQPVMRAAMAKGFSSETASAPIEAGEGVVRVVASGSIELLDGTK